MSFRLLTVITLTAGTMFVMWLGEQITERGIGNGISLIIFAGIAAGIPAGLRDTINLFRNGEFHWFNFSYCWFNGCCFILIIIFTERAYRKVPVQYAKRVVNNRVFGGQTSHLPIKVNISGVMPPIFASALTWFSSNCCKFVFLKEVHLRCYFDTINQSLYPGKTLYNVVFVALIIFFVIFMHKFSLKLKILQSL